MESLKSLFVQPDPQAQLRKCNSLIRSNVRKLDREIVHLKQMEIKAKTLILQADKRMAREPQRQVQARREVRVFARELIRSRKTSTLLATSKAQLNSVQMQVNEAFAVRKIDSSIRASVGIMRDVNSLIRLPELTGTMQELSGELMKAGIIEEMVSDSLPENSAAEFEDEADEDEVDKVLGEILKDRMATSLKLPTTPITQEPVVAIPEQEEEEGDTEATMDQMRNRLEALKS